MFRLYKNQVPVWTNVYGLARSLLALGTLITLVLNPVSVLFRPILGVDKVPVCHGIAKDISIFCMLEGNLVIAKLICVLILIVVITGYLPALTGFLHCWVSFSFMNSAILVDGGDHITSILTFLLLPITVTDSRRNHWAPFSKNSSQTILYKFRYIIALPAYWVIRIQVSVVYLHAAIAKCSVNEWLNGTAIYYWFIDPSFGYSSWLNVILKPLIINPVTVSLITWFVIIFEFLLFAALISTKQIKIILFILGILFHIGIALIHGLGSFAVAMSGALTLYLYPWQKDFRFKNDYKFFLDFL